MILESARQLYYVVTDKLLFVEWVLQILRAISIYFLKIKATIESDTFAETNEEIDMRTAPKTIKNNIIHNEEVLNMRWDLCKGCEFLTDANKCQKCGCFMSVKHKLAHASCPIGKWDKYLEDINYGSFSD